MSSKSLGVLFRSTSSTSLGTQLLLPAPPSASSPSTTANVGPKIDLLSGDDFSLPTAADALALVPVGGEPQPASPVSQQNALALVDMFSPPSNSQSLYSVGQTHPSSPQFQQQSFNPTQPSLYPNGSAPVTTYTQGSNAAWNGQISQQQQSSSPVYGAFLCHSACILFAYTVGNVSCRSNFVLPVICLSII